MTPWSQQGGNPPPVPASDRMNGEIVSVKFSLTGDKAKVAIHFADPPPDGTDLYIWVDAAVAATFVTAMGSGLKVDVEPSGNTTPETYTFHA